MRMTPEEIKTATEAIMAMRPVMENNKTMKKSRAIEIDRIRDDAELKALVEGGGIETPSYRLTEKNRVDYPIESLHGSRKGKKNSPWNGLILNGEKQ